MISVRVCFLCLLPSSAQQQNAASATTLQTEPTSHPSTTPIEALRKIVVFIKLNCEENAKLWDVKGTGFFVGYHDPRLPEGRSWFVYLVTNKHVAQCWDDTGLLIYNNLDPIHMWGTEDHDFIAAMYGQYTLVLDRDTGKTLDAYQGRKHSVAPERNTSFSAVGRLMPVRGQMGVTLFENAFAKIKLPTLPTCFEVKRFEITYSQHA